jgi:STE24 endopeptidase
MNTDTGPGSLVHLASLKRRLLILWLTWVCLITGLVLGFAGERLPAGPRPADLVLPVDTQWHASLPRDPGLATQAFLDRVPAEMRERGESVSTSRYFALAARLVANVGALLLFLWGGCATAVASWAARLLRSTWARTAAVTVVVMVYQWVITLPVEVAAGYLRWRHFGFADRPFVGWLSDAVLNWLPISLFTAAGLVIVMTIIRRAPRRWPIWAGGVYFVLATLYTIATPGFIEPLLNNYSPLPESAAKQAILEIAHRAGVADAEIVTSDASRQGRLLNAHVSGMAGTARITVDDTMLEHSDLPTIRAVVAHEIGHYRLHHIAKAVVVSSVVALGGFVLIAWVGATLVRRFGQGWGIDPLATSPGVVVLWTLFSLWGFVAEPITNVYLRSQEADADNYSLALSGEPQGLAEYMIHDADMSSLDPTWLTVALFYDHPSAASRVANAMQWRAHHPQGLDQAASR